MGGSRVQTSPKARSPDGRYRVSLEPRSGSAEWAAAGALRALRASLLVALSANLQIPAGHKDMGRVTS